MDPFDFAHSVKKMTRGFTPHGTFSEASALLVGFMTGSDDQMFGQFQQWLGGRFGRPELAFWHHILAEAFPDETTNAHDLDEEQNQQAVAVLFRLFEEFLIDIAIPTDRVLKS